MSFGWVERDEDAQQDLWLRWPANDILAVRVTLPEAIKYSGHWYLPGRVYRRCLKPDDPHAPNRCPYCPRPGPGKPVAGAALWRHVLSVEVEGGEQRIWEFSESVANQLKLVTGWERRNSYDGRGPVVTRTRELLGLRLVLSRVPPRANGAVVAGLDPDPDARGPLPTPLDVGGYIGETWRRAAIKDGKAPPTLPGFG